VAAALHAAATTRARSVTATTDRPAVQRGFPEALFRNFSPLRYEEAVYYGLFRKHIFILMFDPTEGIRFTHSPSGGGLNKEAQTTNPAWDFQYILPKYEVKKE
jgi:hypothetical protein